ncbi:MAG: type II secretion system protein [Lachnospiraceae bacterium]|nr:type II secretion system protein [Lachnospiraceae bacterium]
MRKGQHKNRGFTLVELVVVITILGMLLAILVPQLLGYVDESRLKAEFSAGECCRQAAQAKLNALAYRETQPNYNNRGVAVSSNSIELWHPVFADPVIEMSGQEVRNLFIAMGRYDHYEAIHNTNPVYKVYYVAYQRNEDSPVVFYDGSDWMTECPFGNTEVATINGESVAIQFFCLKFDGKGVYSDPAQVFNALKSGTY